MDVDNVHSFANDARDSAQKEWNQDSTAVLLFCHIVQPPMPREHKTAVSRLLSRGGGDPPSENSGTALSAVCGAETSKAVAWRGGSLCSPFIDIASPLPLSFCNSGEHLLHVSYDMVQQPGSIQELGSFGLHPNGVVMLSAC